MASLGFKRFKAGFNDEGVFFLNRPQEAKKSKTTCLPMLSLVQPHREYINDVARAAASGTGALRQPKVLWLWLAVDFRFQNSVGTYGKSTAPC
jgi:hypothetical protein